MMKIIFVEGYYDEEFFKMIYRNNLADISIKQYSQAKKIDIDKYLKSINCMPNSDYLFFADADGKDISEKKQELIRTYKNLNSEKIYIVCFEIESWYCAGLTSNFCTEKKIKYNFHNTDTLTKEQFVDKLPKKMMETSLTIDMLKNFSIFNALEKNKSFKYFYAKEMSNNAV